MSLTRKSTMRAIDSLAPWASTRPISSHRKSINIRQLRQCPGCRSYYSITSASKLPLSIRVPPRASVIGPQTVQKLISKPLSSSCPRLDESSKASPKKRLVQQGGGAGGALSFRAAAIFVAVAVCLTIYFREEKARMQRKRIAEANKGVGTPKVGGPFELIDQNGKPFSSEDMKGKFSLVYFGFTHCPDICPDELDKMVKFVSQTKEKNGNVIRPIFFTCDPARDTPAVIKSYLLDFSPDIVGLTGTYEQIKATCKAYRVYFSTPPHLKPGQDYLVDHSIYFYLMDPDGHFIEALGRHLTPAECTRIITDHIKDWKGELDRS